MSVQQYIKIIEEGASTTDWDNEFQSFVTLKELL